MILRTKVRCAHSICWWCDSTNSLVLWWQLHVCEYGSLLQPGWTQSWIHLDRTAFVSPCGLVCCKSFQLVSWDVKVLQSSFHVITEVLLLWLWATHSFHFANDVITILFSQLAVSSSALWVHRRTSSMGTCQQCDCWWLQLQMSDVARAHMCKQAWYKDGSAVSVLGEVGQSLVAS